MKLNLHITLTVLSGVILAGLLTGCPMPTKEGIARNTTEYNLVAEKAGNEMLLLNIVRASKRRPMYFTSFSKLTGNMTFEIGTGSINIPFGRIGDGLNGSYSIAPTAGYKNSPLFDLAVLDTQEFTRGIMTPVPMKTIEYYRSQGWPKEMLLHLFIRCIDIKDPNYPNDPNRVEPYVNDPEDPNEFNKFQRQIRDGQWDIEVIPNPTKIGKVGESEASKLQNLIEVHKAGLTLTPVIEEVNATSTGKVDAGEVSKLQNLIDVQKAGPTPTPDENKMELRLSQDKYVFTRKMKIGEKLDTIPFSKEQGKIYTRSPEAILYYLGEILRAENRMNDPNIPMIYAGSGECEAIKAKLFYALETTDEDVTPCVSVDYEGTRYVIPEDPNSYERCCEDRSMHVLSLVSQLIGLQKKSAEAPSTATVSVIGR